MSKMTMYLYGTIFFLDEHYLIYIFLGYIHIFISYFVYIGRVV